MKIQDNRYKGFEWPTTEWFIGFITGALFGVPIALFVWSVWS